MFSKSKLQLVRAVTKHKCFAFVIHDDAYDVYDFMWKLKPNKEKQKPANKWQIGISIQLEAMHT